MEMDIDKIISIDKKKKKATYSFDEDLLIDFNLLAKKKKYNKSNILNNLLKEFLNKEKILKI